MRRSALLLVAVLLSLCTACVGLPDEGPVEVGAEDQLTSDDSGFPYDPRPPQPGEEATEIVRHFLDAMTANPVSTSVAREFLATRARDRWKPERRMITYGDLAAPPVGTGEVTVRLRDANYLDARGAWQGRLPRAKSELTFSMTVEDAEWRIADPPDAMVVTDEWFEDRYRQVSLYFFDPTGNILVPEPVFVPRGGQLATALMRGLLRGPGAGNGVSRSFIPSGVALDDLSVQVSEEGLAEVSLSGEPGQLDPEGIELMTVQIAWTLRQDPSVKRVRVTLDGTPVSTSGLRSDFSVDVGQNYDPNGAYAWQDLFGLRDGRMVSVVSGVEERVRGPFGRPGYALREIAVDLSGRQVAGVTSGGTAVLVGSVDVSDETEASVAATGGTDFAEPVWDHSDTLWLLDRRADGAQVSVVADGRRRTVRVPGVTGRRITTILVSRDGTRLVAVRRGKEGDQVVVSRLARNGDRVRASRARVIARGQGEVLRVRDLGWWSPTELVMTREITDDLSQVTTFSVDGSPATVSPDTEVELVRDQIVRLVTSPLPDSPAWGIAADGTVYPLSSELDEVPPRPGLDSLSYVG